MHSLNAMTGLDHQHIAILGFGREGQAVFQWLSDNTIDCRVTVVCEDPIDDSLVERCFRDKGREVMICPLAQAGLDAMDVIIKSPGISLYREEIQQALAAGVTLLSSSQLWFDREQPRTAVITGTKGKSTVTQLVAFLAGQAGLRVSVAGNIGTPLVSLLMAPEPADLVVVEMSSYQLADTDIHADIVLINNLYPEHLDWHGSLDRYYSDKLRAVNSQVPLIAYNAGIPACSERVISSADSLHRLLPFNADEGWHMAGDALLRGSRRVLDSLKWPLRGAHNAENLCAALTVLDGLAIDTAAGLHELESFRPLPHRLEALPRQTGLPRFINDSISTTPHSSLAALSSFPADKTVIIVGGYDRQLDWQCFVDYLKANPVLHVACTGQNGRRIQALIGTELAGQSIAYSDDLTAVMSSIGPHLGTAECVLFSPGAPSFDQYDDYAVRGEAFKTLVAALEKKA